MLLPLPCLDSVMPECAHIHALCTTALFARHTRCVNHLSNSNLPPLLAPAEAAGTSPIHALLIA